MNEKIFTLMFIALAVAAVLLLPEYLPEAPTTLMTSTEILTDRITRLAILLSAVFSLLHVLRGTAWDFYKEIMDQHNVAGAVFVGAIILSIGMVLAK